MKRRSWSFLPTQKTYPVPAFAGLGALYWCNNAGATISGMRRLTGKAEIIRTALDSIVYQITDIVQAMEQDTHMPLASLRTDSGPIKNGYLMQFQSGILGTQVEISQTEELSFCGAAFVAGMAVSLWDHRIHECIQRNANRPIMDAVLTEKVFRPKKAVEATLR